MGQHKRKILSILEHSHLESSNYSILPSQNLFYHLYNTILQYIKYLNFYFPILLIKIIYLHNKIFFHFLFFSNFLLTRLCTFPQPLALCLHHAHHATTAHYPPKSHQNKNPYKKKNPTSQKKKTQYRDEPTTHNLSNPQPTMLISTKTITNLSNPQPTSAISTEPTDHQKKKKKTVDPSA